MLKKKVVLVGASARVRVFVRVLTEDFADRYEIAGLMDVDPGKMQGFCESLKLDVPCFTDFDAMCDAVQPDMALVTTVDRYHAEYVVRALDRKIGVICEKPLCISAEQCRAIRAAQARNPEVYAVSKSSINSS